MLVVLISLVSKNSSILTLSITKPTVTKEASLSVIQFCFGVLNLRKINLGVVEKNNAAVNLYKSMGFEIEGIYKAHAKYNSEYCDIIRMAIFKNSINKYE